MLNNDSNLESEEQKLWNLYCHYRDLERWEQALSTIERLLSMDVESDLYHYSRSRTLSSLNRNDEALTELYHALELGYSGPYRNFEANIHWKECDFLKAEECFIKGIEENPNDPWGYVCYADLMMFSGCVDKANLLINKALELDPDLNPANFLKLLSQSITDERNFQTFFNEKIMEISNEEVDKLFHLSLNEYFSKKYIKAKDIMIQAFSLDPTNKKLERMLYELDYKTSFFYLPHRIVEMTGGQIVWWMALIIQIITLRYFKHYNVTWFVSIVFILLFVYMELSFFLFSIYRERKGV